MSIDAIYILLFDTWTMCAVSNNDKMHIFIWNSKVLIKKWWVYYTCREIRRRLKETWALAKLNRFDLRIGPKINVDQTLKMKCWVFCMMMELAFYLPCLTYINPRAYSGPAKRFWKWGGQSRENFFDTQGSSSVPTARMQWWSHCL